MEAASADPRVAAGALGEEAADRTAKTLGFSASAGVWLADFVLPSTVGPAFLSNETMAAQILRLAGMGTSLGPVIGSSNSRS
jgi:hypothetical protein